jgi:hypothetical protein
MIFGPDTAVDIVRSDFRDEIRTFGITYADRLRHVHVLGKPGMGKSFLLLNIARQDILNGCGVTFFDTAGDAAKRLLDHVPISRSGDVVYYRAGDGTGNVLPDFDEVIESKKVCIVDLSKMNGAGEEARKIALTLLSKLRAAANRRGGDFPPHCVFFDECPLFSGGEFAMFMSDARRHGVAVVLAHQHLSQLSGDTFETVMGTCGTIIAFRVGYHDAEVLEKIFKPKFIAADFTGIGLRGVYTNLMANGSNLPIFSAKTITLPRASVKPRRPDEVPENTLKDIISG